MPSPDASPYVDLRVYDLDTQSIYENAISNLQMFLPEWTPREGNTEVLLLENMALEVSEAVFALNRLPNSTLQGLLTLFAIDRDNGAQPTTVLQFNVAGTQGTTIPAGTRAQLTIDGALEPIIFSTDVDLVVETSETSGTVTATGDQYTAMANGMAAGITLEILDSAVFVDSVVTSDLILNGRDPEDDITYFTRAVQRFARLSDTLVLPRHFTAYCLDDPNVGRAFTIDNWDANVANTPGTVGGHVTVAVYGQNQYTTSTEKTTLLNGMTPLALANLAIHIIDPTITPVNVTVTVQALPGYDPGQVTTDVTTAITSYLNPMTWGWGTTVRYNELISLVDSVDGVDYVASLASPSADVTLSGNAPLAQAGTVVVNVNPA